MMGWGYMMRGWGWLGMTVFLVVCLAVAAAIIYGVIRILSRNHHISESGYDRSLELLNERYAKGEIDEEEYRRRKESLTRR